MVAAVDQFETRHRQRSASAEVNYFANGVRTAETDEEFRARLIEVRRNRLITPYTLEKTVAITGGTKKDRRPKMTPYDLYQSIWRPRIYWADSNDLYDTEEIRFARFENDFQQARELGRSQPRHLTPYPNPDSSPQRLSGRRASWDSTRRSCGTTMATTTASRTATASPMRWRR